MANKVVDDNEIYLGGTYYPLNRPVQSVLASIYPSKVTIGDTTRDSNLRSSIIAWSDWHGTLLATYVTDIILYFLHCLLQLLQSYLMVQQ